MSSSLKRTKVYFLVIACFMTCMLILCSYKFNITERVYRVQKADVHFRLTLPKQTADVSKINMRSIFSKHGKVGNASSNYTADRIGNYKHKDGSYGLPSRDGLSYSVKFHNMNPNSTTLLTNQNFNAITPAEINNQSQETKIINKTYVNISDEFPDISNKTNMAISLSFESTNKASTDVTNDQHSNPYTERIHNHSKTAIDTQGGGTNYSTNETETNKTRNGSRAINQNKHQLVSNVKTPDNLKYYLMKLGLPNRLVSQMSFGQFSTDVRGTVRPDLCKNCFKNDFEAILDEPSLCQVETEVFILITISSTVSKRASRDTIRQTWGTACNKPETNIKCLFMFGKSRDGAENQALITESKKYRDIAQYNFLDSYANLTYKTMTAMRWAEQNCPNAVYVMKTDDDMYVNTELLPVLLQAAPSEKFMGGVCWGPSPPHRDRSSKWFVSFQQYSRSSFPSMCSGTGYVLSGDVIPNILTQSQNIPFFYLEDVYIALCLKKIGVRPLKLQGFHHSLVEFEPCNYRNSIITSHGLNHFDLLTIWKASQSCELRELTPSDLYSTRPY